MLSRLATVLAVACSLILVASPARAVVWQVGPNLGMDVFSIAGSAAAGIAVPEGTDPLFGVLRPSLRFGAWSDNQRHEVYLDTGAMLITSESTYTNLIATLNYSHAFRWGSAPYVTAGFGTGARATETAWAAPSPRLEVYIMLIMRQPDRELSSSPFAGLGCLIARCRSNCPSRSPRRRNCPERTRRREPMRYLPPSRWTGIARFGSRSRSAPTG